MKPWRKEGPMWVRDFRLADMTLTVKAGYIWDVLSILDIYVRDRDGRDIATALTFDSEGTDRELIHMIFAKLKHPVAIYRAKRYAGLL